MNEDPPLDIPLESAPVPAPPRPEGETYRVKMSDGQLYGPITLDQIVQWAREGRIPRDALLYPEGGGDPKSVFAEPRLASILSAPPTLPTMAMTGKPLEPAKRTFFCPPAINPHCGAITLPFSPTSCGR